MYPSDQTDAKRQRNRAVRQRLREAGYTEIIVLLPKERVAELDEVKDSLGLANRGQAVEQLLLARRQNALRSA
jgi:hypothetical protein